MKVKRLIPIVLAMSCIGAVSTDNISRMLDASDLNTYQALNDITIKVILTLTH